MRYDGVVVVVALVVLFVVVVAVVVVVVFDLSSRRLIDRSHRVGMRSIETLFV